MSAFIKLRPWRAWVWTLLICLPCACLADSDWWTSVPNTTGVPLDPSEPVQYGEFYGRLIRLQHGGPANGRLIATFEHFPFDFQIYRSDDDGFHWRVISKVVEQHLPEPWTFEGEPHLFEVPKDTAGLPAGTILLAGSAVMTDVHTGHLMQHLEVYASRDHGETWTYRGTADQTDGSHGNIWEPNLQISAQGDLVMYFSDERFEPTYNQILAERVSYDGGTTWGPESKVVAVPDGVQRPGMAVTQRLPNGRYVMSYEWVNPTLPHPARIRFSDDGIHWGDPEDPGLSVQTENGSFLGATPYIVWLPFPGPDGALIVSGRTLVNSPNKDRELFVNYHLGLGPWHAVPAPVQWQGGQVFDGWSMGMIPTADGRGIIQMASSYAGSNCNRMLIGREPLLAIGPSFYIVNQNSGLDLGAPGDSTTAGTYLQQLTPEGAQGEIWTFQDLGNECYLVVNPSSGLAVDDYAWQTTDGSPIDEWLSNGYSVQQWRPMPLGDGSFKFMNVFCGKVMGVEDESTSSGAPVLIWDDNGTPDHNWYVTWAGSN